MNNMNEILEKIKELGGPLEVSQRLVGFPIESWQAADVSQQTIGFQIERWKAARAFGQKNASDILNLLCEVEKILKNPPTASAATL